MSKGPWVMEQEWKDVYFLHWPILAKDLREHVPQELEIDTFDGMAWLGVVYFQMRQMSFRFIPPIPGTSPFWELNVRTYVKYKGKSGVYFFSINVNNPIVSKLASVGDILPFQFAKMYEKRDKGTLTFQNRREENGHTPETLIATVKPISEPIMRTPLEFWLTERHYLWTKTMGTLIRQYNGHTQWVLQRTHGVVHENTIAPYLMGQVQKNKPIVHYSKYKKACLYLPIKESQTEK